MLIFHSRRFYQHILNYKKKMRKNFLNSVNSQLILSIKTLMIVLETSLELTTEFKMMIDRALSILMMIRSLNRVLETIYHPKNHLKQVKSQMLALEKRKVSQDQTNEYQKDLMVMTNSMI